MHFSEDARADYDKAECIVQSRLAPQPIYSPSYFVGISISRGRTDSWDVDSGSNLKHQAIVRVDFRLYDC
jgi:hypothetical protein